MRVERKVTLPRCPLREGESCRDWTWKLCWESARTLEKAGNPWKCTFKSDYLGNFEAQASTLLTLLDSISHVRQPSVPRTGNNSTRILHVDVNIQRKQETCSRSSQNHGLTIDLLPSHPSLLQCRSVLKVLLSSHTGRGSAGRRRFTHIHALHPARVV